jgi:hypothetical protein
MGAIRGSEGTARRGALLLALCGTLCGTLCGALCLALAATASAQSPVVFDETTATVNGDLILKSDVLWNLALDPSVAPPEFWQRSTQEMMQRTLVDQRLLLQEAAKLPATAVTDEEIDAERAEIANAFNAPGDDMRFTNRIRLVGLTEQRLRSIIRERLRIEKFVDFRFRSFVIVTEPEIVDYFETEVKPKDPGAVLDALRDQIQTLLTEEKINNSIDSFLEDARARAEIVTFSE